MVIYPDQVMTSTGTNTLLGTLYSAAAAKQHSTDVCAVIIIIGNSALAQHAYAEIGRDALSQIKTGKDMAVAAVMSPWS